MTEMNPVSRFFVNQSATWRSRRTYGWVRTDVVVPESVTCLEIGSGSGEFAARFVRGFRPFRYVATDVDPHQLEVAKATIRKRLQSELPPSLVLREADMLHLPFDPRSFDLIFAFVAIHHASPDHHDFGSVPQALSEIDRVLRPGGQIVYQEFLHKAAIRDWLHRHQYEILRLHARWRLESVVARKPSLSPAVSASPVS